MVSDCEGFQRFFFFFYRLRSWSSLLGTGSKREGEIRKKMMVPEKIPGTEYPEETLGPRDKIPGADPHQQASISPPPLSHTLHKMNWGRVPRPQEV